jgi:hypothetical protein
MGKRDSRFQILFLYNAWSPGKNKETRFPDKTKPHLALKIPGKGSTESIWAKDGSGKPICIAAMS